MKLTVKLDFGGDRGIRVGTFSEVGRDTAFEFAGEFLSSGLNPAPFRLPPGSGLKVYDRSGNMETFGLFDDSLPDGWGRRIVDRMFMKREGRLPTITERLMCVGRSGKGALVYEPADEAAEAATEAFDLAALAEEAMAFDAGEAEDALLRLRKAGGSSGGTRPKAYVGYNPKTGEVCAESAVLPPGFEHWIVKFNTRREGDAAGETEYRYYEAALAAGADIAPSRLVATKAGKFFMTRRFDRKEGGGRVHMASAAGLLHADFRVPGDEYALLFRLTDALTRDRSAKAELFRRACLNVVAHNRDDHLKNFSFLMDEKGRWSLAPFYDFTRAEGPNGWQTLSVAGEGANPGVDDLRKLAKDVGLENHESEPIMERVVETCRGLVMNARMMLAAVAAVCVWMVPGTVCNAAERDAASWVDPFIGTAGTGHTFPAACVPFGMVKAGPDTGTGDWEHCSGYQFGDSAVLGFSQTHLSGTGCPDMGDVSVLPNPDGNPKPVDKRSEKAEPGYYAVTLADGTRCEMTATERCALYRFTYMRRDAKLLVNLPFGIGNLPRESWGGVRMREASVCDDGKSTISGTYLRDGWATGRRVGFDIRFNIPWKALHREAPEHKGEPPRMIAEFELPAGCELLVKIGLSSHSAENAGRNLCAEIPGWDFDGTRRAAKEKWNGLLGRVEIEGSDEQKKNFYTALYHLFLHPDDISDYGEKPFYSTLSTWDTFRAAHPLYTILVPERVPDMVDSMLRQGEITGYLPIWPLGGVETQCMVGTHSVPVIVDWFLKERAQNPGEALSAERRRYWGKALDQIKETLVNAHEERLKERWDLYDRLGYYPFDEIKGESVSRTMECAYDDWCAGVMARELGRGEDAEFFFARSRNWRNVFDPSIGLVRGKDSQGRWRDPYNPYKIGQGAYTENDFTEGNAFQYTWHVLHDPAGLIEAMGGRENFVRRLDALFDEPEEVEGSGFDADITGLIGQYVHGNEPSHHVIYFYTLAGHPEKTAGRIREVFDRFYSPTADGLCGNEDCGQMSAWYIFSALGFYPFNPCGGEYVLGAPQLPKAVLNLAGGRRFVIVAKNLSSGNKCVDKALLDGKPLEGQAIRHSQIMIGGELDFEMK